MGKEMRISDSELEVMTALWDMEAPATMAEILACLRSRGWEDSTVKTFVGRLVKKGALTQEKKGVYYYAPAVSRDEYGRSAVMRIKDRLYRGSVGLMLSSLVEEEHLTRQEIDELYEILKNAEEGET